MAEQLRVFVSHSHEDNEFCQAIVAALRDAGADVWYDQHNLTAGQLGPVIEQEIEARPAFIVILSQAALNSRWVQDECRWAYSLFRGDRTRTILPVIGSQIVSEEDIWLFLRDFRRIGSTGLTPCPVNDATRHMLHALPLTPQGETPASWVQQPAESVDDLIMRGRTLSAQGIVGDALPLFERATELAPSSFDAWFNLGLALNRLGRYSEALTAHERAIALDRSSAIAWTNLGNAFLALKRYAEALTACERAVSLDSQLMQAWNNIGSAFNSLGQPQKSIMACNHAIAINPYEASPWNNKGNAFNRLGQYADGNAAFDRALSLDPNFAVAWSNKTTSLRALGRDAEADAAEQRARELSRRG